MVDNAALDDHVGVGEAGLDVAAAQRPLMDLVGAELLVHERRPLERRLGIGYDRQRLVLDDHHLGRVHDRVAVLAEHHCDRIADVLDGLARQRPVLGVVDLDAGRNPGHRQRPGEIVHV